MVQNESFWDFLGPWECWQKINVHESTVQNAFIKLNIKHRREKRICLRLEWLRNIHFWNWFSVDVMQCWQNFICMWSAGIEARCKPKDAHRQQYSKVYFLIFCCVWVCPRIGEKSLLCLCLGWLWKVNLYRIDFRKTKFQGQVIFSLSAYRYGASQKKHTGLIPHARSKSGSYCTVLPPILRRHIVARDRSSSCDRGNS